MAGGAEDITLSGGWLTAAGTQAVARLLADAGHQVFLVGGCVRNALMGRPVADIDMATDARPERVLALAEGAGIRAVATGLAHGTVTLIHGGVPHEVTTFRRDVETDGRRATVAFAGGMAEDAARRDFTMNALYARADGRVIDPLGGLPDVLARRVRFVGDAGQRIAEDYLRILRFFRFHAVYGDPQGGIDAEGLAACAAHSAGIDTISRERIGAEMRKLLAADDPAPAVAAMAAAGILARVLPGADSAALAPLIDAEGRSGVAPLWVRRLAALGGAEAEAALRLSREEGRRLSAIRAAAESPWGVAATAQLFGAEAARDGLLLRRSVPGTALAPAEISPDDVAEIARGARAQFPVTAADLMPALTGPDLGQRLEALHRLWLAQDLRPGKDALLAP